MKLIESAVLVRVGGDVGATDVVDAEEGLNGLQRAAAASIFVFVGLVFDVRRWVPFRALLFPVYLVGFGWDAFLFASQQLLPDLGLPAPQSARGTATSRQKGWYL